MNRIILSLAVIAMAGSAAVATTRAYFTNSQVLGSNTFATGTVVLDTSKIVGLPLTMTNMSPGKSQSQDVNIQYTGTLNADTYLGVSGTSDPGDPQYFSDHLNIKITDRNNGGTLYEGTAAGLSSIWLKLMENIGQNQYKYLKLTATLAENTPSEHQGVSNTDTVFLFYTIQTGGDAPAAPSWNKYNGTEMTI